MKKRIFHLFVFLITTSTVFSLSTLDAYAETCTFQFPSGNLPITTESVNITIKSPDLKPGKYRLYYKFNEGFQLFGSRYPGDNVNFDFTTNVSSGIPITINKPSKSIPLQPEDIATDLIVPDPNWPPGSYEISVRPVVGLGSYCDSTFTVTQQSSTISFKGAVSTPVPTATTQPGTTGGGSSSNSGMNTRIHAGCANDQINTAIGCIPVGDSFEFTKWILGWSIGIAGGIAFLLIVWAGIQMMTAQGNPEKLNAGREVLTAAISGLVFIIFSVFLLNLIGYNILKLPGF